MKGINCMVVDDEPLAIDVVVDLLAKMDIHPVCCENGVEALRRLQEESFDLLFLDIEMPGLDGISLLKGLSRRPAVVITTAYRDYAVEGFELEVLDYLVKPFSFSRMQQTLDKFARMKGTPPEDHLFLKVDKRLVKVWTKDILYLESKKDYVRVYTTDSDYLCHLTLAEITAKLPGERFLRVHRSFTVALDKISLYKEGGVHIRWKVIPVSREVKQELRRRLQP